MTKTQKKAWNQLRLQDFKFKRQERFVSYVGKWSVAVMILVIVAGIVWSR